MWLLSTVFTSCKKESDDGLLLEQISVNDVLSKRILNFEYDSHGRLTKVKSKLANTTRTQLSIAYDENGEISKLDGMKVEKTGDVFTLFSDDTPVCTYSLSEASLEIKTLSTGRTVTFLFDGNGNIIDISDSRNSTHIICEKYDDKKSPFYSCATPTWALAEVFLLTACGMVNNLEALSYDGEPMSYTYEYNSAGYPTKQKSKGVTFDYTYRKK